MRRVSAARKQRLEEVGQWREDFRASTGKCEMCLVPHSAEHLDIHETTVGSCRAKALDKSFACMTLCRPCHNVMELLTIPQQLAYFMRAAPDRFDLEAYFRLTQRRWPDLDTILAFKEKL